MKVAESIKYNKHIEWVYNYRLANVYKKSTKTNAFSSVECVEVLRKSLSNNRFAHPAHPDHDVYP